MGLPTAGRGASGPLWAEARAPWLQGVEGDASGPQGTGGGRRGQLALGAGTAAPWLQGSVEGSAMAEVKLDDIGVASGGTRCVCMAGLGSAGRKATKILSSEEVARAVRWCC